MKHLIAIALLVGASAAHADIPLPPEPPQENYSRIGWQGETARDIYLGLNTNEVRYSEFRPQYTTYKLLRTKDGLVEIICFLSRSRGTNAFVSASCSVKQSTDGKPVPKEEIHPGPTPG